MVNLHSFLLIGKNLFTAMNKIVALYFLINSSKPKDTGYPDADHTSLQAPVEASGAL